MRILLVQPGPSFSVQDVYAGWAEALRELGCHVVEFNLADRLTFYEEAVLPHGEGVFRKAVPPEKAAELAVNGLYSTLYKTRPDVMLLVSGFFADTRMIETVRSYGTRVVTLFTESPYEDERQLRIAPVCDLSLLNDPVNIERYLEVGRAFYVPHSYRPSLHRPGIPDPKLAADLGFVGTGYASRIGFFEAMDLTGLDVLLGGNWKALAPTSPLRAHLADDDPENCLDNTDTVRVYQSAKVGMNLYRREGETPDAVGWAMGPREVEMAACGMFFLRDPRPEGDDVLSMLPTFRDPEEASTLLRWYLDHEDIRQELAGQAREAVADRSFHNHAAALLRLLEKKE